MLNPKQSFTEKCYKDKNGKIVLAQSPNIPIIIWIIFSVLSYILPSNDMQALFAELSTLILFVWAYLELFSGVNYFRKALGFVVMLWIITNIIINI